MSRDLPHIVIYRARQLAVEWMTAHGKRYEKVRVDYVSVTVLPYGQTNTEHARGVG
jgi:hypothetical protein